MSIAARFDPHSAEIYARYAATGLRYRTVAQALLDEAGDLTGQSVVELGCRSGLLTGMLAQAVGTHGFISAVDDSYELISIAREQVTAPNVKFILNDEYDIDSLIAGRQDAAFSNAAFWQYDQEEVLSAFHHLLKPGGNLYFNLSGGFFDFKASGIGSPRYDDWPYRQSDILKRWVQLARKRYPYHLESPDPRATQRLAAQLERDFQAAGFTIRAIKPVFFEIPRDDELDWLRIPVWTERFMGQIPDHERYAMLDEIFAQIPPDATFVGKWVTVVAERE